MADAPPAADAGQPAAAEGGSGQQLQRREERRSTGRGYYDLDAVLAEETAVPCAFIVDCAGVGRALDPSAGREDVAAGARMDLPLWLLPMLVERDVVSVRLPRWYGERMRRKIQAGAGVESLRARCAWFYDVAQRLHALEGAPPDVGPFAAATFRARYRELLIKALSGEGGAELARTEALLSEEEAQLWAAGRASIDAFSRWRFGGRTISRNALKRRLDSGPANGRPQ